jgi:hypothetical protein
VAADQPDEKSEDTVEPLSADEIRKAFVNTSRSQVKAMNLPTGFEDTDWEHLDYLGWRDPKAPLRAYLATRVDGSPVAVALNRASTDQQRRGTSVCDLCLSAHPSDDVALYAARRAGSAGRQGNTVGTYICADLACSLYARGLRRLELMQGVTMPLDKRLSRLEEKLEAFVGRVLAA